MRLFVPASVSLLMVLTGCAYDLFDGLNWGGGSGSSSRTTGSSGGNVQETEPRSRPPAVSTAIVFVSRDLDPVPSTQRQGAVDRPGRGKLLVRETSGDIRVLVDAREPGAPPGAPTDVMDPDVSFDARRIVFSGFSTQDGAWRIYEIEANGRGLRRITHSDRHIDLSRHGGAAPRFERYDDLDPCYLPDGRICFVSTRYPQSAPEFRFRATNLYVVNGDGTDLHRITSERFAGETPTVDPRTGQIVFSRWWRSPELRSGRGIVNPDLPPQDDGQPPAPIVRPGSPDYRDAVEVPPPAPDPTPGELPSPSTYAAEVFGGIPEEEFPGVNSWSLASIDPDGSDLAMFSGFHLDREATQAYRPSFHPDGTVLALFLNETPLLGRPGRFGLRRYDRGLRFPTGLGGPQTFAEEGADFFYSSVAALPDGNLLVTGTDGESPGAGGFDIYVQQNRVGAEPVLVLDGPNTAELDAVPLVYRKTPRIIEDEVRDRLRESPPRSWAEAIVEGGTFTFRSENLFANGPVNAALPNAPPVGERLFIEFYMAPQRTSFLAADPPLLIDRLEVPADGKIEIELPAGVPVFEVLRFADDIIPVGRDGQIFHVGGLNYGMPGQTARCVGCHAGHSTLPVRDHADFTNLAASAVVSASSVREEDGATFRPELLVDRRTDFIRSEWAAEKDDRSPRVRLEWAVPIQASGLVLYAPAAGNGVFGLRKPRIGVLSVRTYLAGELEEQYTSLRAPHPAGTKYPLSEDREIDALEISIDLASGTFEGGSPAALAEVEVIARVADGSAPGFRYLRGDANCDGGLNTADTTSILRAIVGGGELCCEAAADVNDDRTVNLSDSVFLLNFLFQGGSPPPEPFPSCGGAPDNGLACEEGCR